MGALTGDSSRNWRNWQIYEIKKKKSRVLDIEETEGCLGVRVSAG